MRQFTISKLPLVWLAIILAGCGGDNGSLGPTYCDVEWHLLVLSAEDDSPIAGARIWQYDNRLQQVTRGFTDATGTARITASAGGQFDEVEVVSASISATGFQSSGLIVEEVNACGALVSGTYRLQPCSNLTCS